MAKKSKPVKKAAPKKVPIAIGTKKAATKSAAPKGKKAPVKPASPAGRKAVVKKAAVKKAPVKKTAPKKVAKAPAKKIIKKAAVPKKAVTKPAAKTVSSKQKNNKNTKPVSAASTPAMAELSEEMNEKNVHSEKESQSMMQSGEGAKKLERKEDPVMAYDMHMAQKATSKGDRNNKLRVSSTGQRPIRPSGKKPLWRK